MEMNNFLSVKRKIFLCLVIDLLYFAFILFVFVKYRDVYAPVKTPLYIITSVDDIRRGTSTHERLPSHFSLIMLTVDCAAQCVNISGCYDLLYGKQRKPIVPIKKSTAAMITGGVILVSWIYVCVVRNLFAGTYPRVWMLVADDIFLPLLFIALSMYSLLQMRFGSK